MTGSSANRIITARDEIVRIWESLGTSVDGWDQDFDEEDTEEVFHAVETFAEAGQPAYIVHYEVPVDWNDCPEVQHVACIEEVPNYVITNTPEGCVVDCSNGESFEIPVAEDEDVWNAIERYDDAHGTHLWESMDEKLVSWRGF